MIVKIIVDHTITKNKIKKIKKKDFLPDII